MVSIVMLMLMMMMMSCKRMTTRVITIGGKNKITDKCQWMLSYYDWRISLIYHWWRPGNEILMTISLLIIVWCTISIALYYISLYIYIFIYIYISIYLYISIYYISLCCLGCEIDEQHDPHRNPNIDNKCTICLNYNHYHKSLSLAKPLC